ncbi:MAG: hypothetical protein QNJ22_05335 [Desulfosarcinaceae bacterium]|nr:hypothetical protein [Desulfosarcinaceae bacterium]
MDRDTLIRIAYERFAGFAKPVRCTLHDDDCPDCREHNQTLCLADHRSLSIEQIGSTSWSPIPHMSPAAMAHFMPRLMELALKNTADVDGGPFAVRFIHFVLEGPAGNQFQLFAEAHRDLVFGVLTTLKEKMADLIETEGWRAELETALGRWGLAGVTPSALAAKESETK